MGYEKANFYVGYQDLEKGVEKPPKNSYQEKS
jgi:hypothetical protein